MGGGVALLAFLGGTWFPIPSHGFLNVIGQLLPSYWLVQAGHVALGGHAWPAKAWIVIAVWTVSARGARPLRLPARHRAGVVPARLRLSLAEPRLPDTR